jgi:hypothetical protein
MTPETGHNELTEPRAQARAAVALLSKVLDRDDPATLNRAVELLRSALAGTGGQPVPPGWLSNLGVALRTRYVRLGAPVTWMRRSNWAGARSAATIPSAHGTWPT